MSVEPSENSSHYHTSEDDEQNGEELEWEK